MFDIYQMEQSNVFAKFINQTRCPSSHFMPFWWTWRFLWQLQIERDRKSCRFSGVENRKTGWVSKRGKTAFSLAAPVESPLYGICEQTTHLARPTDAMAVNGLWSADRVWECSDEPHPSQPNLVVGFKFVIRHAFTHWTTEKRCSRRGEIFVSA